MEAEKARIIFMGTPDYAIPALNMLLENGYDVVCVVTQEDKVKGRGKKLNFPPVKVEAIKHKIPVLQPKSLKTKECEAEIMSYAPDLYITIAYGKIIPGRVLEIPKYGCINVHASLLPKYRGPAPIWRAIIDGEKKTGVTTMFTDEGIDTGDMLLKKETDIGDETTAGMLHDQLSLLSAEVLKETLEMLFSGRLKRVGQKEEEASYAPLITKQTGHVNWNTEALNVRNLIRGLNPCPAAYTYYMGSRMKILFAEAGDEEFEALPGTIVRVLKDTFVVACKGSSIRIKTIQMPDKRVMSVEDYLNGNTIKRGVVLD